MDKVTKKNSIRYNQTALDGLVLKYGLSRYYIKQSISESVKGITPDQIRADYKKLNAAIFKAEQDTITQFLTENKLS